MSHLDAQIIWALYDTPQLSNRVESGMIEKQTGWKSSTGLETLKSAERRAWCQSHRQSFPAQTH